VPLQDFSNRPQVLKPVAPKPPTGVFASIFFLITLLLYGGVPISQFVIGLIYVNQCTVRQFISIYMILSGIFGIAFVVVDLLISWPNTISEMKRKNMNNARCFMMALLSSSYFEFFIDFFYSFKIENNNRR